MLARLAVPQQEFEAFLAKAKVADSNVVATEANIRINEAEIHRLETLQSFQKVTAPFSGVITARNFDPGDLVTADSTSTRELFHLVRMDTLRVFANVPQMFATDVKVGQKAVVYRREDPKRTFTGTITRTADALDLSTRTLLTEVQVPNPTVRCGRACTSRSDSSSSAVTHGPGPGRGPVNPIGGASAGRHGRSTPGALPHCAARARLRHGERSARRHRPR